VAPGGALAPGGGGIHYAPGASPMWYVAITEAYHDQWKDGHGGQPGWMPSPVPTEQSAYVHQQGWSPQGLAPLQHQSPPISELGAAH
jgi:hypothetical protein